MEKFKYIQVYLDVLRHFNHWLKISKSMRKTL